MRHGSSWEYFTVEGVEYKRRLITEPNGSSHIEWQKIGETSHYWLTSNYEELEKQYQEFIYSENRMNKLKRILNSK